MALTDNQKNRIVNGLVAANPSRSFLIMADLMVSSRAAQLAAVQSVLQSQKNDDTAALGTVNARVQQETDRLNADIADIQNIATQLGITLT